MPRNTKTQVREYVSIIANEMGLGDWRFEIEFKDLDDANAQVTITNPPAKRALIEIHSDYAERSREDFRQTIVHELTHCVLASYCNMAEGIISLAIPGSIGDFTRETLVDREEEVAHWFARTFSKHLSLIRKE